MIVKLELEPQEIYYLVRGALLDLAIGAEQLTSQFVDAEDLGYLQSKLDTIKTLIDRRDSQVSPGEAS
jgi:flagellar biosynthesis/type III secretory pathway protein FliH